MNQKNKAYRKALSQLHRQRLRKKVSFYRIRSAAAARPAGLAAVIAHCVRTEPATDL
jgi:hypothetical protein